MGDAEVFEKEKMELYEIIDKINNRETLRTIRIVLGSYINEIENKKSNIC